MVHYHPRVIAREKCPYTSRCQSDETPVKVITKLALSRQVGCIERVKAAANLKERQGRALTRKNAAQLKANAAGYSGDSEADILSGISRKCRMRSGFY